MLLVQKQFYIGYKLADAEAQIQGRFRPNTKLPTLVQADSILDGLAKASTYLIESNLAAEYEIISIGENHMGGGPLPTVLVEWLART